MTPFLQEIASKLLQEENLESIVVILPSKRASNFLLNYLGTLTEFPFFSPKIISIESFIEDVSGHQIIANTELLLEAYDVYSRKGKESFDEFLNWAEVVVNDFNEIDRYLVPIHQFFNYLSSIKKLEYWGETQNNSKWIEQFFKFWDSLSIFYHELNQHLSKKQKGYQGAVYKKAAEDIEYYLKKHHSTTHWFVGFNALNKCEQQIIQALLENSPSKVFWDQDQFFLSEKKNHNAGLFLRNYLKQWKYYKNQEKLLLPSNYSNKKRIHIYEAPHDIAQVKFIGDLIKTLSSKEKSNTALVLADEKLLLPLLHSLPSNVGPVNITMGIPIRSHPIISLVEIILEIKNSSSKTYYYKNIEALLSFGVMKKLIPASSEAIISHIRDANISYLSLNEIIKYAEDKDKGFIKLLFDRNVKETIELKFDELEEILNYIISNTDLHFIEHAVIKKLLQGIEQTKITFHELSFPVEGSFLQSLFERIIAIETLDLEGNPQEGLQIMGILETRVLDFEQVIMVSVNEGILPQGKSHNSFITYDLKKQFHLPSHTEKDAVYAYHFFRLLQRTKDIILIYKGGSQGIDTGERSRFIRQIEIEDLPNHTIIKKEISQPITLNNKRKRKALKTNAIINRLKEIANNGFSPSALTTYIRNPYQFYAQRILRVQEFEEVEETVAYNTLGTIVHETIEQLYLPFKKSKLKPELLKPLKKKVDAEITRQFKKHFKEGDFTKGKNLIIFEVSKKYIEKFIDWDLSQLSQGNIIELIDLEQVINIPLEIDGISFPVQITGTIDRVDSFNGKIRVIDYKSGKVEQADLEIVNWKDLIQEYEYSKAFQVLMYSYLLSKETNYSPEEAGIISFKNMQSGLLKFGIKEQSNSRKKDQTISETVLKEFEAEMKNLITEICDASIPFVEKEI